MGRHGGRHPTDHRRHSHLSYDRVAVDRHGRCKSHSLKNGICSFWRVHQLTLQLGILWYQTQLVDAALTLVAAAAGDGVGLNDGGDVWTGALTTCKDEKPPVLNMLSLSKKRA